ncbi:MAG: amidohydrolase [Clostridia bacterium]|nr:amidohydrolase [Clostridia bacterium]
MKELLDKLLKYSSVIEKAERYLWKNAEVGYKEIKSNDFMKKEFISLGYTLRENQDITGFSAELDTGKEGPTLALLAELDALYCDSHPETNKETGAVHACGHNIQCASLLSVACVLSEKDALDKLSGKIRFIVVPAEEGVEISFRNELIKKGVISFTSGKPEMIKRGFFDGVDIAVMMHLMNLGEDVRFYIDGGSNGNIRKKIVITGKASHAGEAPQDGVNALNAASLAISATNYLRETFRENDVVRFHSIITSGGSSVNVVPDKIVIESYVRAENSKALLEANERINRAIICAVASLGATVEITDLPGSEPLHNDKNLVDALEDAFKVVAGEKGYRRDNVWKGSCTDMGDVSTIIPSVHGYVGGLKGKLHGKDYVVEKPLNSCLDSALCQLVLTFDLLGNGAERARKIIKEFKPVYPTIKEYIQTKESVNRVIDAVKIIDNGVEIKY